MSVLTMVRHGQASYLSEDYDRLSPLGEEQARLLADYWASRDVRFDAVFSGPRRRQVDSCRIVAERFQKLWPEPVVVPAFDEYQGEELFRYCLPKLAQSDAGFRELTQAYETAADADRPRAVERLFQELTSRWVRGEVESEQVESWVHFRARVHGALDAIRTSAQRGSRIVIFTSAGPISSAVQKALQASDAKALELSWVMRNASLTEFLFSGQRFSLIGLNAHPHLSDPKLITYR